MRWGYVPDNSVTVALLHKSRRLSKESNDLSDFADF